MRGRVLISELRRVCAIQRLPLVIKGRLGCNRNVATSQNVPPFSSSGASRHLSLPPFVPAGHFPLIGGICPTWGRLWVCVPGEKKILSPHIHGTRASDASWCHPGSEGLAPPLYAALSGRLPAISARCALYARSADVLRACCRRELSAIAPLSDRRSAVLLPRHSDDEFLTKSAVLAVDHTPVEVAALQA